MWWLGWCLYDTFPLFSFDNILFNWFLFLQRWWVLLHYIPSVGVGKCLWNCWNIGGKIDGNDSNFQVLREHYQQQSQQKSKLDVDGDFFSSGFNGPV